MKQPKKLKGYAKEFWHDNAKLLIEDGVLTEHTLSGFLLCCECYDSYKTAKDNGVDPIKVVALSKQLQLNMGLYGLNPIARKKLKLDENKNVTNTLAHIAKLMGDEEDALENEESEAIEIIAQQPGTEDTGLWEAAPKPQNHDN